MSFLSSLLGAIPVVGPALGAVGGLLGKKQQGAAEGRLAEGQLTNQHDRNAIDLYGTQQTAQNQAGQTDLERKKYTDAALGDNARRAITAALLGGGLPHSNVSVKGVPNATFGPGLSEALLGNPEAMAALKSFGSQSHTALDTPQTFTGGEILNAPSLTALPQAPKGSGFLNTLATLGQLAGAASPFIKKPGSQPMDEVPDPAVTANMRRATGNVRF